MKLFLLLSLLGTAAAGGLDREPALLGTVQTPAQSAFCLTNGCRLEREGPFMASLLTQRFSLNNGDFAEFDLHPHSRVVTNARLMFGSPKLTAERLTLARTFLEALSGRHFATSGLSACFAAAAQADPDGPNALLSHWTTPAKYPYKARCGAGMWAGVWLGYR
ncbi:hypothetical protein EHF33_05360 [Deinococcus psychrotolerans]|uniref:Uncharacterized protein n=2 Tax=Deinococcus psychrotolerans TaxID=2489213 RepID=A0A3G8YA48_9DEIO|nr:hypothetical protein EHF33_05360 [Deinococcus psychrotolerans]